MNDKLLAQLRLCKLTEVKPNFSALSREYGIDRRTIKRYYDGYQGKPTHRAPHSKLDQYEELIRCKFQIKGATFRSVYEFIFNEVDDSIGTYSNFRKYVVGRGIAPKKKDKGHPRFETQPGHQAQVDWKEDISIVSRQGEVFTFQVFNLKLGYSRYCHFVYKTSKTQQDVIDSLLDSFQALGGIPEEILFDNMSSVVTFTDGKRNVSGKMKQFAKDFGFRMRFAGARKPYTKGKVESSNKFIDWVRIYEGEFDNEAELKDIIFRINKRVNEQVNQATNIPPMILFQKEINTLKALPSKEIMDSYRKYERNTRVAKDATIVYRNTRYSTPPKYIGEEVSLKRDADMLHIYHDGICVASHMLSDKRINYRKEDYVSLLAPLVNEVDVEDIVADNLKMFDTFL